MGDALEDYIKDCFKDGYTEDEVRERLKEAGYEQNDVDGALDHLLEGATEDNGESVDEVPEPETPPPPIAKRHVRRGKPSMLPAVLFLILCGLLLLAAGYYYLFVMEMDCTGDPESFRTRFANCRPARTGLDAGGMSVQLRILDGSEGRCNVEMVVTAYAVTEEALKAEAELLRGKSMVCRLTTMPSSLESAAAAENECEGDLLTALKESGRLDGGA